MKTTPYILCTLLLWFGADFACANVVTVSVTAHVVDWHDWTGTMGGQIANGMTVTGTYTYDSNTPEQFGSPGQYLLTAPSAVSVAVGPITFQGVSGSQAQTAVNVYPSRWPGQSSSLRIFSYNDQASQPGAGNATISFSFSDLTGQWPASTLLPTGAAPLQDFSGSQISIADNLFDMTAQVDSVQLVPSPLDVFPTSGTFVAGQHFDVAFLFPVGAAQITSIQGTVYGPNLPPAGLVLPPPGLCQPAAPTSAGRPLVLCPNGDWILHIAAGPLPPGGGIGGGMTGGSMTINWQVSLADGTILYQTVVWGLVQ